MQETVALSGVQTNRGNGNLTGLHIVSICVITMMVAIVPILHPLVLGALSEAGHLRADQIGYVATAEYLATAAVASLAAARLQPVRLRLLAGVALALCLIANISTSTLGDTGIFLARIVTGGATGVVMWIYVGMLTRVANPARIIAIIATVVCGVGFLFSMAITTFLAPRFGVHTGSGALAIANLVGLAFVLGMPRELEQWDGAKKIGWPDLRGIASLLVPLLQNAGMLAAWVFLIPIAREGGMSAQSAGQIVTLGIAGQIAGGILATILASRLRATTAIVLGTLAGIAGAASIYLGNGAVFVTTGFLLIGMTWMFSTPFHMPFLLEADSTHRAAMLMSGAQILGAAAGPSLAGISVAQQGPAGAIWTSLGLLVLTVVVALFVRFSSR